MATWTASALPERRRELWSPWRELAVFFAKIEYFSSADAVFACRVGYWSRFYRKEHDSQPIELFHFFAKMNYFILVEFDACSRLKFLHVMWSE
jgi:hypothetical protein